MEKNEHRIEEALNLLKVQSVHCASEEEATAMALQNPVRLDEKSQKILGTIATQREGYKKASFYLPESLLAQLEILAEQGIDPAPLMEASLQNVIQVAHFLLAQKQD